MTRWRIKFSKTGLAKHISHLDLLRVFTRAMSRARLPVRYSEGMNPHQILSFALPLSLGVTSECEYVDVDFAADLPAGIVKSALSDALPPDIRVISAAAPLHKFSFIEQADYAITFKAAEPLKTGLAEFFSQPEIKAVRVTKSKSSEINLKEHIRFFNFTQTQEPDGYYSAVLRTVLPASGELTIKASLLADAFEKFIAPSRLLSADIHRCAIFSKINGEIVNFA